MSFPQTIYQLLIGPLELIFETAFGFANNFLQNSGLSIIVLSLTINVLLLPLYRRADRIQAEEREAEEKMSAWTSHIKKTFHGDERFMMLQTYYRQNDYRPFYALRGSLPLLLEIPFFIAAYHFLSNLEALKGLPFGPIPDLGAPDGLIKFAGLSVNLLPVLMTAINFVSSAVYTKGHPLKEKIQLYGMALIFLVLLYDSPSGLVFYWTLNNLFSLFKNLFSRLKDPKKILRLTLAVLGGALFVYGAAFYRTESLKHRLAVILLALLLELPLLLYVFRDRLRPLASSLKREGDPKLFFGGGALLTVLTGVLIPSAVVLSSPAEFVHATAFSSPLRHVLSAFLLAAGLFLVWFGVFYFMTGKKARWGFDLFVWIAAGIALVDYMFFATKMPTLSAELKYETDPVIAGKEKLLNLAAILALAALFFILYRKSRKLVKGICTVLTVALLGMSLLNIRNIQSALPEIRRAVESAPSDKAQITLSKNGKNVIVLMLDRAISSYLPYLFQERPELEQQFAGFTWYPNTISHGASTNVGAPGLYGGYEYTPEEMNKRADEPLVDKHNEALKVLPVLFSSEGYDVTVLDPSYANYSWIPDLSIYDEYPDIKAYNTEHGQFTDVLLPAEEVLEQSDALWRRNFFCYSIMKISPVILQPTLYQNGSYFDPQQRVSFTSYGMSYSLGIKTSFAESYSALCALPQITEAADGEKNVFLMMCNSTPHEATMLQEPAYEPASVVDNREYDAAHTDRFVCGEETLRVENAEQMMHYQSNMAALLKLGSWMDHLRALGVYDNTRIIIVADHGNALGQFDGMLNREILLDVMQYNPLLMVKDFGSTAFTRNDSFMTNADTPSLAVKDLIADPVNPFTGKPITPEARTAGEQHVLGFTSWHVDENNGNTFLPGVWYGVQEDLFDISNWKKLGEY